MEPMLKAAAPQAAPADLIKDSDQTKFAKDVLEASRTVPVIVDFWAPWCGPCKTLQPTIEKVVKEAKGAVKLVKINIDQNQMLAQQLRIQSIPAVIAYNYLRGQVKIAQADTRVLTGVLLAWCRQQHAGSKAKAD